MVTQDQGYSYREQLSRVGLGVLCMLAESMRVGVAWWLLGCSSEQVGSGPAVGDGHWGLRARPEKD